ncbi:MAG: radical SAM protein, partial [Acidobacteria bacterium]|nr:radical SAM protein [Acidobacteriota bacterium]
QFVTMTPFPGTIDFDRWEKSGNGDTERIDGIPLTRYWLIPGYRRPKLYMPHPVMSAEEIRMGTQRAWDSYYSLKEIWKRAQCVKSLKARLAFVFISKLYRQMYASTGIAIDSARRKNANRWARWTGLICLRLFRGRPIPDLRVPGLSGKPAGISENSSHFVTLRPSR